MTSIPCLSLWQPWAATMLYGPKDLENRPWPTRHRGPLLVHAAKTQVDCNAFTFSKIREIWPGWREFDRSLIVFGAIVGIVDVVGCGQPRDFPDNPWAWGPYCHVWANRRAFHTPIPFRGMQGIFSVPHEVVAAALAEDPKTPAPAPSRRIEDAASLFHQSPDPRSTP